MSDTTRQVGSDLPLSGITAANCKRKLSISLSPGAIYTIEGDRAALLSGKPAIGSVFETILDAAFRVTKVDIDDLEARPGAIMTITTETAYENATYGTADIIGAPKYSVKFQELRQRIEAHPCCGTLAGTPYIPEPTWEDWAKFTVSNWIPRPEGQIPGWLDMGAWSLSDYQNMKRSGIDEYVLYLPAVTSVQSYTRDPGDIGKQSGRRNAPPTAAYAYAENYDWLCGPDELQERDGKYERTTSWMACERVLPKLYSNQR